MQARARHGPRPAANFHDVSKAPKSSVSASRRASGVTEDAVSAHLTTLSLRRARGGVTQRKAQGAHYTPAALVDHLVAEATRGWRPSGPGWRLVDPACGSGNFLAAAARALAPTAGQPGERQPGEREPGERKAGEQQSRGQAGGTAMAAFLAERVFGVDIDPVAVRLARRSLLALLPPRTPAAVRRRVARALAAHIVERDALSPEGARFLDERPFDLILGNPPFLNQLEKGTAASRGRARRIASATDGAVKRYTDLAAAFLLTNLPRLAEGGRLAFVMPQSFLSTGDARAARDAALAIAPLRSIWSANESLFEDANVRVCALVFARGPARPVRRAFGADFAPLQGSGAPPRAQGAPPSIAIGVSWSALLAEAFGAPRAGADVDAAAGTVADIAHATADFRDQYYGLRGAIREDGPGPRLITTKHIDLAHCGWGECEVRALGVRYTRPTIEAGLLDGVKGMDGWLEARCVPKVLVATQTKVIEAWVDERGEAAPLVPIITVTLRDARPRAGAPSRGDAPSRGVDLWMLAAALASPVVAARALALYAGSALSPGAIKLSAKQLLAMPLPRDRAAWRESARHFKAASAAESAAARDRALRDFAESSCAAHGLDRRALRDVLAFWRARCGARA